MALYLLNKALHLLDVPVPSACTCPSSLSTSQPSWNTSEQNPNVGVVQLTDNHLHTSPLPTQPYEIWTKTKQNKNYLRPEQNIESDNRVANSVHSALLNICRDIDWSSKVGQGILSTFYSLKTWI